MHLNNWEWPWSPHKPVVPRGYVWDANGFKIWILICDIGPIHGQIHPYLKDKTVFDYCLHCLNLNSLALYQKETRTYARVHTHTQCFSCPRINLHAPSVHLLIGLLNNLYTHTCLSEFPNCLLSHGGASTSKRSVGTCKDWCLNKEWPSSKPS